MDKPLWGGRGRDRDLGGAFQYSRRGLRLRRRGAYGIHRASGPWCQGLRRKVASLRSGGRRLAGRIMMECHFCALPRTPFPASRDFPSRGNERYEGKNSESYTSDTISAFSPFGGWRHHLAPWEACHLILSRLRLLANRVTRFPVEKVRRSRIRGSRVAADHQNAYHAI